MPGSKIDLDELRLVLQRCVLACLLGIATINAQISSVLSIYPARQAQPSCLVTKPVSENNFRSYPLQLKLFQYL